MDKSYDNRERRTTLATKQLTLTDRNNNNHDNIYGAVIMAEPLQEFTRFI